jgi:hypothetical protein
MPSPRSSACCWPRLAPLGSAIGPTGPSADACAGPPASATTASCRRRSRSACRGVEDLLAFPRRCRGSRPPLIFPRRETSTGRRSPSRCPSATTTASPITNIYTDRVVFPVTAAVTDSKSAVDLAVSVDLGVCDTVCIPDHVEARLLVPRGQAGRCRGKGDRGRGAPSSPVRRSPGSSPSTPSSGAVVTDKRPTFEVAVTAPDAGKATLFVEGPSRLVSRHFRSC